MTISVLAVSTGTAGLKQQEFSWVHNAPATGTSDFLLACVGAVDHGRPNVVSATYSGIPMTTIASTVGAGGDPFPYGYMFYLASPPGTSGTIQIVFDEYVSTINGASLALAGVSGTPHVGFGASPANTQWPDFDISVDFLTPASGAIFDLCMSQSSNHNIHVVGSGQTKLADVFLNGPRFSTSYRLVSSGGMYTMSRLQSGGPHAGSSLTAAFLKA